MNKKIKNPTFLRVFFGFLAVFFAFFGIFAIFKFFSYTNFCVAENQSYIISSTSAVVFSQPDFSSTRLATLSHKTEVQVEVESGEAKIFSGSGTAENYTFFHVSGVTQTDGQDVNFDGYIMCDLLAISTQTITQVPSFNAQTNAETTIFEADGETLIQTQTTLQKGTRIFLYEGYDKSLTYTAISFYLDGQVQYGYILTSAVSPDGVNSALITCIILIVALLGIIFAWVFMKNKNKIVKVK